MATEKYASIGENVIKIDHIFKISVSQSSVSIYLIFKPTYPIVIHYPNSEVMEEIERLKLKIGPYIRGYIDNDHSIQDYIFFRHIGTIEKEGNTLIVSYINKYTPLL